MEKYIDNINKLSDEEQELLKEARQQYSSDAIESSKKYHQIVMSALKRKIREVGMMTEQLEEQTDMVALVTQIEFVEESGALTMEVGPFAQFSDDINEEGRKETIHIFKQETLEESLGEILYYLWGEDYDWCW